MSDGPRAGLLVVGVGNPGRGDDAVGRLVARRVRERGGAGLEARECSGEATDLIDAWTGFDEVVVVDACRGAGEPGSLHRFVPEQLDRLAAVGATGPRSTHGLDVCMAIGLARALCVLPRRLVVYAIEGRAFDEETPLSPEVDRAADALVERLLRHADEATPA